MAFGGLIDRLQALGVGALEIGAAVPLEPAAGLAEVVLVERGDLEDEAPAFEDVFRAFQKLLVGEGQLLVAAGLEVKQRDRLESLQVVGVHLQDPFEDGDGPLVVGELVAD